MFSASLMEEPHRSCGLPVGLPIIIDRSAVWRRSSPATALDHRVNRRARTVAVTAALQNEQPLPSGALLSSRPCDPPPNPANRKFPPCRSDLEISVRKLAMRLVGIHTRPLLADSQRVHERTALDRDGSVVPNGNVRRHRKADCHVGPPAPRARFDAKSPASSRGLRRYHLNRRVSSRSPAPRSRQESVPAPIRVRSSGSACRGTDNPYRR